MREYEVPALCFPENVKVCLNCSKCYLTASNVYLRISENILLLYMTDSVVYSIVVKIGGLTSHKQHVRSSSIHLSHTVIWQNIREKIESREKKCYIMMHSTLLKLPLRKSSSKRMHLTPCVIIVNLLWLVFFYCLSFFYYGMTSHK